MPFGILHFDVVPKIFLLSIILALEIPASLTSRASPTNSPFLNSQVFIFSIQGYICSLYSNANKYTMAQAWSGANSLSIHYSSLIWLWYLNLTCLWQPTISWRGHFTARPRRSTYLGLILFSYIKPSCSRARAYSSTRFQSIWRSQEIAPNRVVGHIYTQV